MNKKILIPIILVVSMLAFSILYILNIQTAVFAATSSTEISCGQNLGTRTGEQQFTFTLASTNDVTLTLTPTGSDWDMYVKWDGSTSSESNWDCRPYNGFSVSENCAATELTSGMYNLFIKRFSKEIGSYSISLSCIEIPPDPEPEPDPEPTPEGNNIKIYSKQDVTISSYFPNRAQNQAGILLLDDRQNKYPYKLYPNKYEGLLEFDINQVPSDIAKADLCAYIMVNYLEGFPYYQRFSVGSHYVYPSYNWDEYTVTWNKQPSSWQYKSIASSRQWFNWNYPQDFEYVCWDVKPIIQQAMGINDDTPTIWLRTSNEYFRKACANGRELCGNFVEIATREYQDFQKPHLNITW